MQVGDIGVWLLSYLHSFELLIRKIHSRQAIMSFLSGLNSLVLGAARCMALRELWRTWTDEFT